MIQLKIYHTGCDTQQVRQYVRGASKNIFVLCIIQISQNRAQSICQSLFTTFKGIQINKYTLVI